MELGTAWQGSGFVFTRPDGRPTDTAKVTNTFAQVMNGAGFPGAVCMTCGILTLPLCLCHKLAFIPRF